MARRKQLRLLLALTLAWLAWTVWFVFTGETQLSLRVLDETGTAVGGAVVSIGDEEVAVTDAGGEASLAWPRGAVSLTVAAPGYALETVHPGGRPASPLPVWMDATLLRGRTVDAGDRPVIGVEVAGGYGRAVTGEDGRFLVRLAEPGHVSVRKPAWEPADFRWDGSPGERAVTVRPREVKAVHVLGEIPADPVRWEEMLDLADVTELNALVVDVKDELGVVYHDTRVELAHRVGAVDPGFQLEAAARDMEELDLYMIARIVAFQDPIAARAVPEMAVGDGSSGVLTKGRHLFLDPTDDRARGYALDLALEACRGGADEIQFDYVRYPDGFGPTAVFDGGSDQASRVETIRSFLEEAVALLHPRGCAVAADIFGFITSAADDGGIGQHWEVVADVLDVASPMLYPSHYSAGWFGFDDPRAHPAEVVRRALDDGLGRLDSGVVVRPWLQDFGYDDEQVRSQIDVAESFGLGWMLWNAASEVSEGALRPAGGRSG